ncbi:MAG TPA: T9SS type A sorting domain-containing protein [Flavipsychrobacter sp.]|nr:T9SS type A sorting domain-containing protein [Flavipsychrobacter sp.]
MKKHRLIAILLLCGVTTIGYAQVANKWVKQHTSGNEYQGTTITTDASGNVYIAGNTSTGPYNGNLVTAKYDSVGNQLWVNTYSFPLPNLTGSYFNWARKILADNSGNVYVAGGTGNTGSSQQMLVLKINPSGTLLWSDTVHYVNDFGYYDAATDMEVDPSGNLVISGAIEGVVLPGGYSTFFVIKMDPNGNELWRNRLHAQTWSPNTESSHCAAIAIDQSGNIFAAGSSSASSPPASRFVVRKYLPSGVMDWTDVYDNDSTQNKFDAAVDIQVDAAGNAYAAGTIETGTHRDFILRKYASNGSLLWSLPISSVSSGGWDQASKLYVTAAGTAYITGTTALTSSDPADMMTVKVNTNGVIQWVNIYAYSFGADDVALSIAGENNPENVVVTGYSRRTSYYVDPVTLKYKADGTFVWEKRQPSIAQGGGYSVVIGSNHSTYVTGRDGNNSTTMRITDADAYLPKTVNGQGTYNFNDNTVKTGFSVDLGAGTGTGNLFVNFLVNATGNNSWCAGTNAPSALSNYRWVVNSLVSALSTSNNLEISMSLLNLALSAVSSFVFNGIVNPANFSIYQRPLDGQGEFCKLPTTYANGTLSAPISGFSEFFIGSETDTFNYNYTTNISDVTAASNLNVYPVPANDRVDIDLELQPTGKLVATLVDMSGEKIETVFDGSLKNGKRKISFSTADLSNGMYFLKIQSGALTQTAKVMVMH